LDQKIPLFTSGIFWIVVGNVRTLLILDSFKMPDFLLHFRFQVVERHFRKVPTRITPTLRSSSLALSFLNFLVPGTARDALETSQKLAE
jgi:hypothetical protein